MHLNLDVFIQFSVNTMYHRSSLLFQVTHSSSTYCDKCVTCNEDTILGTPNKAGASTEYETVSFSRESVYLRVLYVWPSKRDASSKWPWAFGHEICLQKNPPSVKEVIRRIFRRDEHDVFTETVSGYLRYKQFI